MNTKILFILGLFLFGLILSGCDVPNMQEDIKLGNGSKVTVGEGEVCKNYYIDVGCKGDLVCIEVTEKPTPTGYCYPINYTVNKEDDFYLQTNQDYLDKKNNLSN